MQKMQHQEQEYLCFLLHAWQNQTSNTELSLRQYGVQFKSSETSGGRKINPNIKMPTVCGVPGLVKVVSVSFPIGMRR